MKTKQIIIAAVVLIGIILISIPFWNKGGKSGKTKDLPPGMHEVTVKEVIQTSGYTYFLVEENDKENWIAVTKREGKPGDVLYYSNPMEMNNFVSKELKRTFPTIYFVQEISDQPVSAEDKAMNDMAARKKVVSKMEGITVELAKDGITIAKLFENQTNYAGKTVTIRGAVSKFNSGIMKKNWAHIQDGTDFSGNFDLTVTTLDSVAMGSMVTFTGKIATNKDFGAGYFYKVIMEDAVATDIKPGK